MARMLWYRFFPDIDECSVYNGGCGHICINVDGSYNCDCYNGYTLTTNGHNCSG